LGRAVAEAGALERGHVKVRLIREIAKGEKSNGALGKEFGVSAEAVRLFKHRHAARIEQVAAKLDDDFAALWVADKANRIAEYQQQVDDIADLMADPERAAKAGVQAAEMMRTAQSALRAVSEELGQLPARTVRHEGGVSVRYEVVGVSPEELR
jgi:hypothetical protein